MCNPTRKCGTGRFDLLRSHRIIRRHAEISCRVIRACACTFCFLGASQNIPITHFCVRTVVRMCGRHFSGAVTSCDLLVVSFAVRPHLKFTDHHLGCAIGSWNFAVRDSDVRLHRELCGRTFQCANARRDLQPRILIVRPHI